MRLESFQASADLVGHRIKISLELVPEADGELGQPGQIVIRRKTRDFDFPVPAAGTDPFTIYDSNAFPPAGTQAAVAPGWEKTDGTTREVTTADTVSVDRNGKRVEVLRRTTHTRFGSDGKPVRRRIEILDAGVTPLESQVTYYYQLNTVWPGLKIAGPTDAAATATKAYGMGARLYQMLPEVYRRQDVITRPPSPGADGIIEAAAGVEFQGRLIRHGQLRRFLDIFGVAVDFMRSRAEGLRELRDVDECDYRMLPQLADWLGWDLSQSAKVSVQRHEIKYAATLYRLTGTIPGCMIWVQRLTGWTPQVHEFAKNVFFTNSTSSVTLDTSKPDVIANLRKFNDQSHYTYDADIGDDHWYSYNAIGIFVQPLDGETSDVVQQKYAKLRNHLDLFLPFNVRGIVILQVKEQPLTQVSAANLAGRSQDQVG